MLRSKGEELLPALRNHEITAADAGLRPATAHKDYRIQHHADCNWITVSGSRSAGLTSALGTAAHVARLAAGHGHDFPAPSGIVWHRVPNISTAAPRDWETAGNGGIVCHCELVSRREIEAALSGPLPARSFAGLKRRTRVTMGRCQGFHCAGPLARITAGHFDLPMAETVHG